MAAIRKKAIRGKKGKKGKRKKAGKNDGKVDKQLDAEKAKANVSLWEARLKATESSRAEYRDVARGLARNNEELTRNQYQLEKDMLDVIGFMKKQDMEKDELIHSLQQQLITEKALGEEERERLATIYRKQISDLQEKYSQKVSEIQIIQSEFRKMQEFRRHKLQLERELEQNKDSLRTANLEHKEALSSMEKRFLQEKQQLEKEAERKVVMLAEKAHTEAAMHLDKVGRSVFKDNVRLNEAISYHMNEARVLQKSIAQLQEERTELMLEKETNEQLLQEKIKQITQKNAQIQELQRSMLGLQRALEADAQEKEEAMQKTQNMMQIADQAERVELQKLQKILELKDRELNRIKKLSHNILQDRTQVERFFLEALEQVKQEIKASRNYYQKMAQAAYHSRMIQGATGAEPYPKIRTFHNKDHSTNDVNQDLLEAEKWSNLQTGRVDIGDLTWEQKEKVLRLLFAKMNGSVVRKSNPRSLGALVPIGKTERGHHPRASGGSIDDSSSIFITQVAAEQAAGSLVLPEIPVGKRQVMV